MGLLLDSFWRAAAYCLHPRVIALSILPLLLMVALALGLGYFFWAPALDWVASLLEASSLLNRLWDWLQATGMGRLKTVLAPLVLVFAITPIIVIVSLLSVAVMMTPALVSLVAERRFPHLQRKKGGSLLVSLFWSLGSTLMALVALVVTVPLWLVPPLILILPPLIWGWLTYRVICFDALADHASKEERREILRRHRAWLLGMGLLSGYLGAAPSLLWASSALFAVAFVILAPLAIWIYTLVFAFSSLWFTHYCLYALEQLRREAGGEVVDVQASYSATAAPSVQPPAASLPPYPPGLPDESKSHGFPPA